MIPEAATKLTRSFLVGYFMPAAFFLLCSCMLWWFLKICKIPSIIEKSTRDSIDISFWAIVFFLAAISISVILQTCNTIIVKTYEGLFPSKKSFLFRPFLKWSNHKWRKMRDEIEEHNSNDDADKQYASELVWLQSYPSDMEDILPTRLGNLIAAFEHYPYRRYGIDAITIWPRLISVIPDDHRDMISTAKSNFDFFINLSFTSYLLGLETALLFCWSTNNLQRSMLFISMFVVVGFLFYRLSFRAAAWWGETVKSAFDLYRLHLLKGFGVKLENDPFTAEQEKKIWEQIQWSMKYRHTPDPNIVKFTLPQSKEKAPRAQGASN